MALPKFVDIHEPDCPIDVQTLRGLQSSDPNDAAAVASSLPPIQKARLAQFCYGKGHLHELALRIASTCDQQTLINVFGRAGKIVFDQSRDADKTLGRMKGRNALYEPKPVSLAPVGSSGETE